MFLTLRRILTGLFRPFRAVGRWLRARPARIATIVTVAGIAALVATILMAGSGSRGAGAADPLRADPTAPAQELSYSGLRDAMQRHKIKSATVKPSELKVELVLKDGADAHRRLLADRRVARRSPRRLGRAGQGRHELRARGLPVGRDSC